MKITLDKKILGGFVICSVTLLVVGLISYRNGEDVLASSRLVNHTQEMIHELDQVFISALSAETATRGFLITNDDRYLQPFNDSKAALFDHVEKVQALAKGNTDFGKRISGIEILARAYIKDLDDKILAMRKDPELARQLVMADEGQRIQDGLREEIREAKEAGNEQLIRRSEATEQNTIDFGRLFILLLASILVVLAIIYVIITANLRALRRAESEASLKNWNLEGSAELARQMQGNMSVSELCQSAIDSLVSFLDVPLGALYVMERNSPSFRLQGAHAVDRSRMERDSVAAGDGLVGQAANEGRQILVYDIEPGKYDVVTSFGNIRPQCVLAIPLKFQERVVGVLELGSLTTFTPDQRGFLDSVLDSISIALMSAVAREEVKDLLEETQRQAEELETQQHELRHANEELEAKTELLEASGAELETQQAELQQANVELEEKANMLEQQKLKLEEAKNEIEVKAHEIALSSKYKSEFLANMSHELRTPLNSILILSQLLGENKHDRLSEKDVEYARNIHGSGSELLNLINEILDLSKIEAGKISLDIDDFKLAEVIRSLNSTFGEVAASRSVSYDVACDNPEIQLHSDRQRLEQILKNLLSNAFKFTASGGKVTFKIVVDTNDNIAFSVTDTGIGIPESKKHIVFEAFQQADGSTKRKYGGTGLGLSISRQLAQALGGTIKLESEEGRGSTFTLILPRRLDPSMVVDTDERIEVRQERKVSREKEVEVISSPDFDLSNSIDDRQNLQERDRIILIIEDDQKFALILLCLVRERNYKGIIASQGSLGISYARHYRPDAIILDMKLPVMNGDEVLVHLKMDPELRHIPVQIISAFDYQKKSLALGAFDYLTKPIAPEDLHKAFDKIEHFKSKKLKKLLIIEDNVQQNNAIRELIGNEDVKSFSAYSGAEGQAAMMNESFDCIIVDLGLPDMSGFKLLESIKSNEKLSSTPVIVYTGKDLSKSEATRLHKLSDAVVLKTVNSHDRLLDETMLFLHRVESKLPREKQMMIRKLHRTDEVLRGKKVLVVDDDIRNIYSLTNLLDEEGMIYITAENGKVAVDLLKNDPDIQLVLMDVMMPVMDGYEATAEIRKDERFRKLPIIALTAKAMKGDKEKCLAAGMSDYVSKPVNIDQLLSLMRVWLYN